MDGKRRYGFSLIEVLVSILILAVGVIGAAGMQLTALRTTQQSAFQTIAVQLASEMADKMRANDSQMRLDDNDNPFLAVDDQSAAGGADTPVKLCYASTCTAAELARFDIHEWKQRLKATLPNGRAVICRDASPWDIAAGALTWNCKFGAGNASLVIKLGWQAKNSDGALLRDPSGQVLPIVAITVQPYSR